MREDPSYKEISKRFHENPDEFADALQELGSSYCIEIWGLKQDIWGQKFLKRN